MFWLLLLGCLGQYANAFQPGTYFLTGSKYLHQGVPYNLSVNILNTLGSVKIQAELQRAYYDYNYQKYVRIPVAMSNGFFQEGTTGIISINVPKDLDNQHSYKIHVRGSNGLNFERDHDVSLSSNTIKVLFDEDKGLYKPGQKVLYRIVGFYPDLHVYTGGYNIIIKDSDNTKQADIQVQTGPDGTAEGEFQLAEVTPLGRWTIEATPTNKDQRGTYSSHFTVQEYHEKRFDITIDLPHYALTYDTFLTGTVKATYPDGKAVKGQVVLHAYKSSARGSCGGPPDYVELAFPINGQTQFQMPMVDIKRKYSIGNDDITIMAIVKEESTGIKLNTTADIHFYYQDYRITWISSSPENFAPKLSYTAYLKVDQPNGQPLTQAREDVRVYSCIDYRVEVPEAGEYPCSSFTGTYAVPKQTFKVPPSGIIAVNVDVPDNATTVRMKAHYMHDTDTISVGMKNSISNNYVQLLMTSKNLKAGQMATFTLEHTEDIQSFTYEVMSRGTVTHIEQVQVNGQNPVTFSFPVTHTHAPIAHVIAYYARSTGEVVADSLSFHVEDVFDNQMTVAFSQPTAKPGDTVDIMVTADPHSIVTLSVVDDTVWKMEEHNLFVKEDVLQSLKSFVAGNTRGYFSPEVLAISTDARRTPEVFSDTGLFVITDADNYDRTYYNYYGSSGSGGHTLSAYHEKPRVNYKYPDTWVWQSKNTGSNGRAIFTVTVPDAVTTWTAHAYGMNPSTGLGVTPTQAHLKVSNPFYVSVHTPDTVLRGEKVVISATVFNNMPSDADVSVTLSDSTTFVHLGTDGNVTQTPNKNQVVTVNSGTPVTVYFPIMPSGVGVVDITVTAKSPQTTATDTKHITVQYEGARRQYTQEVFVDVTAGGNFNEKVNLSLPVNVVKGSEMCKVKTSGDMLGFTLDGLNDLAMLPELTGSQYLVNFAPSVFLAKYLEATQQLTPALSDKLKHKMAMGVQMMSTFQSGSYYFNNFNDHFDGYNYWLSTFMLKALHQAKKYVYVDPLTLTQELLNFYSRFMSRTGYVKEPKAVTERLFERSSISVTAMALLAFIENSDINFENDWNRTRIIYTNMTRTAVNFLINVNPPDPYTKAIVSYALNKANTLPFIVTHRGGDLLSQLNAQAITHGDMKYWTQTTNPTSYYQKWTPPYVRAQPIDIETNAYALLATTAQGDLPEATKIAKWLMAQRNVHGGFAETVDTVIALEALAEYETARKAASGTNLNIDITSGSDTDHVTVTNQNAMTVHNTMPTAFPTEVDISASGNGAAYVEVDTVFNINAEIGDPAFDINTVLLDDTYTKFRLMTCIKWIRKTQPRSGMTYVEISIPSGFEPDVTTINNLAGVMSIEQRGNTVQIFFDEIGKTSICFNFLSIRTSMVFSNQKSYVKATEYYHANNQATVFYEPRRVRNAGICDVCKACCPKP